MDKKVIELLKILARATEEDVIGWESGDRKQIFPNSVGAVECWIKIDEYTVKTIIEQTVIETPCLRIEVKRENEDVANITGGSCCGGQFESQTILPMEIMLVFVREISNLTIFRKDLVIRKPREERQKTWKDLKEKLDEIMEE